ncbi:hypothetical protein BDZ45DRAFT_601146, partial [Acephala macrosclerotiorum]
KLYFIDYFIFLFFIFFENFKYFYVYIDYLKRLIKMSYKDIIYIVFNKKFFYTKKISN